MSLHGDFVDIVAFGLDSFFLINDSYGEIVLYSGGFGLVAKTIIRKDGRDIDFAASRGKEGSGEYLIFGLGGSFGRGGYEQVSCHHLLPSKCFYLRNSFSRGAEDFGGLNDGDHGIGPVQKGSASQVGVHVGFGLNGFFVDSFYGAVVGEKGGLKK